MELKTQELQKWLHIVTIHQQISREALIDSYNQSYSQTIEKSDDHNAFKMEDNSFSFSFTLTMELFDRVSQKTKERTEVFVPRN